MGTAAEVLASFRKRHGDKVAAMGDNIPAPPRIPTGVLEFDIASAGGFPAGHMSVIWGAANSGKSTLLYKTMATYMELHPKMKVAFIDAEGMYSSDYGRAVGIDEDRLLFLQPEFAEQAADMLIEIIREAEDIGMVAVDTLGALCTEEEDSKSFEKAVVGTTGLLVSRLLKVTRNRLSEARKNGRLVTVLYLNQMRHKIGVPGDPTTMPGGNAPHFYSSMKVRLWGGKEKTVPDVDPNVPLLKEVKGKIEKKKGPIVCREFEYEQVVVAHKNMRPGQTMDWNVASAYLGQMGQLGKRDDKKGWHILGHDFKRLRDCKMWYEECGRARARDAIIDYLTVNPDEI